MLSIKQQNHQAATSGGMQPNHVIFIQAARGNHKYKSSHKASKYIYIHIYICVCVCVCVYTSDRPITEATSQPESNHGRGKYPFQPRNHALTLGHLITKTYTDYQVKQPINRAFLHTSRTTSSTKLL